MSKRHFTSDWHLGMQVLLDKNIMGNDVRNFENVDQMNHAIITAANMQCPKDDIIIHVGDLYYFDSKNGEKPVDLLKFVNAQLINIHGNHDSNNKVKSICHSMRTILGKKYTAVSVSHYPTYDKRAYGQFIEGDIHICGHVHGKWKHCLDLDNSCLNINVGIDVWNLKMPTDDDLIKYIDKLLELPKNKLNIITKKKDTKNEQK